MVDPISSFSSFNTISRSIFDARQRLSEAQSALTTGRQSDLSNELGAGTKETVSLRLISSQLSNINLDNELVATRLDVTQVSLDRISNELQDFVAQMIATRGNEQTTGLALTSANNTMTAVTSTLNSTHQGSYLFAGINSSVKPLEDFNDPSIPASRQAVIDAFTTNFGFPPGTAASESITPSMMTNFLNGPYATLFEDPAWTADWSSASSTNLTARISPRESVEASANANSTAVRTAIKAVAMVGALGIENFSAETRDVVMDAAISEAGLAGEHLAAERANLGFVQSQLESATERNQLSADIATKAFSELEYADPYKLSVEISDIMLKLENSYAISARVRQISFLNFI